MTGVRIGLLLVAALVVGCGGWRPHFGQTTADGAVVVSGAAHDRYQFVVHLSGDRGLSERQYRLKQARSTVAERCQVIEVVDLSHQSVRQSTWGPKRKSYAVGVVCAVP